ncbi:TPM domain-containing protein [Candidatus Woesearchaeota archaeon]|nr:TPM domain-containing protein [Candidatus Woesearchaeota archaeon]
MKKLFLILIVLLLSINLAAAQVPTINSYVTDKAGVLSASAKSQLENGLRNLEKETNGVQYAIFIENEYPKEYSLEEYTLKIAEQNRIGKKGNDNGILLYVAITDKKYRWEVGYGVEGILSSPLLGRVSRDYLVPNFKNGDYEKGILEAFDITKRILLNSNDADIVVLKNSSKSGNIPAWAIILFFIFFVIIWALAISAIRKGNKYSKGKKYKDGFYHGAATGLFMGGFGRGGFGGSGGFSGGGGGFGGGGFGGKW